MKINTLLFITGILSLGYSVTLFVAPDMFLTLRGGVNNEYVSFIARALGALAFGYAVMGILSRKIQNPEALRLAAITNMSGWFACAISILIGKMTLPLNGVVWIDFGLCITLSIVFAGYVFSKPKVA